MNTLPKFGHTLRGGLASRFTCLTHGFVCHGIKSACCAKHPRPKGTFHDGTTMALSPFVLLRIFESSSFVRSSQRLPTDIPRCENSDHGPDACCRSCWTYLTRAIFTHVVPLHHSVGSLAPSVPMPWVPVAGAFMLPSIPLKSRSFNGSTHGGHRTLCSRRTLLR
jgi:hypothetical protein